MRRRISAIATVAVAASARLAGADPIVWRAPPACPTLAHVRASVEQRLGGPLALGGEILVDVRAVRGGFVATVDLRGITVANDVRTLTAPRCDDLADAVAVIVARVASEHVGDLERPPEREPPPPPRIEMVPPAVAVAAPADDHEWGYGLRFLGLSGVGGVPEVGVGGELAAHARRRDLFGELAAAHWIPTSSNGLDIGLGALDVRAGWSPESLPIRAWVTGEFGAMSSETPSAVMVRHGWVGVGAGFGVAWPMTPLLRLVGSVEFVAPVEGVRFTLSNGSEAYRAWPVTSRAAFGLEVGIP